MLDCPRPACSELWPEGSTHCAECGARASLLLPPAPAERSDTVEHGEGDYASSPTSSTTLNASLEWGGSGRHLLVGWGGMSDA